MDNKVDYTAAHPLWHTELAICYTIWALPHYHDVYAAVRVWKLFL